ncbi:MULTISPECIES: HAD family hydrolase [Paraburkholderia]|jgi:hypothetical protein|uniref:Uncharacterized protein n=1 Tax=Paraburkholderia aspalathi TaxID=1324617 RepID=A0A1I6ZA22_9BURK|nr:MULTISPECIES: hypothetical protein [Paraburkholderia]MBK3822974.1 hypothetical protein [Paraburkholderia aspalathi]MBK3834787.1 hypothetical protein [Paraburkholderia aspalathi]MBK3843119.1 hypothetical protein [Paraburkholderia aspalathi]MBK3864543.1 hypothetical protein [Paraburkholderia aspalathi]MCX4154220.1 hypothetical protein [Paraburkholderia aspalathi]
MNHAAVESHASTRTARATANNPDDAHLSAFNAAFSDLGLRFRWDQATLDVLKEFNSEAARVTAYIERFHAHLHSAYDADFLAQMILSKKARYYSEFAAAGE